MRAKEAAPNHQPFMTRVMLRNYKSIGHCQVKLAGLTVLVGRNGSGKSNFLDGLRFVADALHTSLDDAVSSRGGIDELRRRSDGRPRNFAVELEFFLQGSRRAVYGLEITGRGKGGFAIAEERLWLEGESGAEAHFHRRDTELISASVANLPPIPDNRLYLVNVAGFPEFREAHDALVAMGFYHLDPRTMKELQSPDAGDLLRADGRNLASVITRLSESEGERMDRIRSYLSAIVPGITGVRRVALGPRETLEFSQRVKDAAKPLKFYAASMSDGTLRALGALVAVTQLTSRRQRVRLVGIEEPETALHPAAAGALIDALREASVHTQVLVTSHSADLLDQIDAEHDGLLVVEAEDGTTMIAAEDPASHQAIRKHLYSPGELLRMDQLEPDRNDVEQQSQAPSLYSQRQQAEAETDTESGPKGLF